MSTLFRKFKEWKNHKIIAQVGEKKCGEERGWRWKAVRERERVMGERVERERERVMRERECRECRECV